MGLLSFLRWRIDPERRRLRALIEFHVKQGMSRDEASDFVFEHHFAAIDSSKKAGTFHLPLDQGDRILAIERAGPQDKEWFAWIRSEGVTDADIRWWWNRPDHERHWFYLDDEGSALAAFRTLRKDRGLDPVESMAEIRRIAPQYDGRPTLNEKDKYPTVALPFELRHRVNAFVASAVKTGELKQLQTRFKTMNDLVRSLIKEGRV